MKRALFMLGGMLGSAWSAVPPHSLEKMPQAAVQQAFQLLTRDFVGAGELDFAQLNRAALEGLLSRLALGAEVLSPAAPSSPLPKPAWMNEVLCVGIRLLRPRGFGEMQLEAMRAALQAAAQRDSQEELILDLRLSWPDEDLERAAAWLQCFVPAGEVAFKLRQIQGGERSEAVAGRSAPLWKRPLLVLVDGESNNVAEAIAAVLQHRGLGLVIGSATRGAAVQYETRMLGGGWKLRFAKAELLLANDQRLFGKGIKPQLVVAQDPQLKRELFALQDDPKALRRTVFDEPTVRFNEAALMAGRNPDLEAFLRQQAVPSAPPPPRDVVLQRAVDLLLARQQWKRPNPGKP
jgi:hypothetical protein